VRLVAKPFGELIYAPDKAQGEAISKAETHTPKIEAPDKVKAGEQFRVTIKVGPHPNTAEHSIRWVELYFYEEGRAFNPVFVGRAFFAPGYAEPEVTFTLKLQKPGVLYAIAYCNLHGLWENRKEIKVE
jgi:superoxide reductase